jgi:hypothetical protein
MGDLVDSSGFIVALLTASGASLLAVVIARGTARSISLGIAAGAGALAGLVGEDRLRGALVLALVLLVVAALVAEGRPLGVRIAALAPGGALIATVAAPGTSGWARLLVLLSVLGACPAAAGGDRRFPVLTFALLAISAVGAYATVPDTEQARSLVGALLPVAVVALAWRRVPESSGPTAAVALLAWAVSGGPAR